MHPSSCVFAPGPVSGFSHPAWQDQSETQDRSQDRLQDWLGAGLGEEADEDIAAPLIHVTAGRRAGHQRAVGGRQEADHAVVVKVASNLAR